MDHDWRGWIGGFGLLALLVVSWMYFATDGFESDEPLAVPVEPADLDDAALVVVEGDVYPEGSLDLNVDGDVPMFIEVSQASGLDDGDRIDLAGVFTDIMSEPPESVVLQCIDDGTPGIEDCALDAAVQIETQQRRFRIPGFEVRRELRVSDGRLVDCGRSPCYLVVGAVQSSSSIASIRLSFD